MTIELVLKRKMNLRALANIMPSQYFFLSIPKTRIKRVLENIINGTIGAKIGGSNPDHKAIKLGISPTKIADSRPSKMTDRKSVALTRGPVIIC